jgi:phage terminase large subunit GpA-like protein
MTLTVDLDEAEYYDSSRLVGEVFKSFLPPDRVSVADFAAAHRWLANEGGGYVGLWEHAQAPYLVGPMEALTSLDHLTVAVLGPGQCGKTAIAENWLLSSVANDPADLLWYMQTDDGLSAYIKSQINPMIDRHPELKGNLGLRAVDDSIHFKRFRQMRAEFLSATYANLINKRAPRIVADEIDAYPPGLGDIKVLLDVRRQTYGLESMLLAISHPDRARGLDPATDWTDGIAAFYADSDRRLWYWPCPHCNGWSSPHPLGVFVMPVHYDAAAELEEIEQSAGLLCPHCGTLIEDRARRAMNVEGGWVGRGQVIDRDGTVAGELVKHRTAGFWIVGAMSNFILGGIGALARARVKAERKFAISQEDETLRQVVVKQWGLPYEKPKAAGSVDANTLAAGAEPHLALRTVPVGVRFLTAFADVQADRFELLVRGWGERGESWLVDYRIIPARPAIDGRAWDELLELLRKPLPLANDPTRGMLIRGVGYDSAGEPGVTTQAGDAWLRARRDKHARLLGKISDRDVWSIVPMKGASGFNAPRLQVTYPDTQRKGKLAAHGQVPQLAFNPNLFKDDLAGQLAAEYGAAWSVHFPAAVKGNLQAIAVPEDKRSADAPHLFFEQLLGEERDALGRWAKPNNAVRNEALDLMVGTHAVARLHGVGRIDWAKPPAYAAEWAANSMIVALSPSHSDAANLQQPALAPAVESASVNLHSAPAESAARPASFSKLFRNL